MVQMIKNAGLQMNAPANAGRWLNLLQVDLHSNMEQSINKTLETGCRPDEQKELRAARAGLPPLLNLKVPVEVVWVSD